LAEEGFGFEETVIGFEEDDFEEAAEELLNLEEAGGFLDEEFWADGVPSAKALIGLLGKKRNRKRATKKVHSSFFRSFIIILR
jgi:hypothetical protein